MRIIGSGYDGDLNLTSVLVEEDGREYWFENPRWISVEERLPKPGAIVLCYTKYFYEVLQWDDDAEQWVGQYSVNAKHYVTHWMPLPEPPEMKEE